MCGIAMIAGAGEAASIEAPLARMLERIAHRGPDSTALRTIDGCGLAHARLSVIDHAGGGQPVEDGPLAMTYNGELYNYRELRAELAREGHSFRTQADVEVVLTAYRAWGPGCLHRFRGMFAMAVWDRERRRLWAARDLFGEKPLYYAVAPSGEMLLASELKAIVASGLVTPRLDLRAVDAFLAFGYVPPELSIYENVHSLRPGHMLEWDGGAPRETRYWAPELDPQPIDEREAAEELRRLARQAVTRQLVADTTVGAFLSGGLDSSTITALMSERAPGAVQTFSVGFGDEATELPYARAVARKYGTEHHEIDLSSPDVAPMLERMAEVYDEPFSDPSHVPTFCVSEFARRHVKVVLGGDGADELFGGYARHEVVIGAQTARGGLGAWVLMRGLSRASGHRWHALAARSEALGLRVRWPDPYRAAMMAHVNFREPERRALWGDRWPGDGVDAAAVPPQHTTGAARAFYFDLASYLPGDILVKVDRAAMASGLETRCPFLDRDLAEFALRLPVEQKVGHGERKILFRRAFADLWPEEIRARGKQGFNAPVGRWLELDGVREHVRRVFAPGSRLSRLLPGLARYSAARDSYRTWILMTLGLWLERHQNAG